MLSFTLAEGASTKPFETTVEQEMGKNITHFERELQKLRTGKAHTSMVEDIRVTAYGSHMPLKEVASIATPEPQLITIQPWDKSLIGDIERSLSQSDIGISPINDGNLIRLPLPKLSAHLREELTKVIAKRLEECKIAIRTVRKDVLNLLRDAEKNKKISEDYSKRLQDILQKLTDTISQKADTLANKKSAEIKNI